MGEKTKGKAVIGVLFAALSVASCGSATTDEPVTASEAEPLVVQQVNAMRALQSWGGEHVRLVWSPEKVSVRNDGDAVLFCGVTSTEKSYHPDRFFGIRPHRARDIDVPISPMVRCVVQWNDAARITGREERELASMFEEPALDGTPAEVGASHGASLVFMPDPMPNLGVQIDDRYTLLD